MPLGTRYTKFVRRLKWDSKVAFPAHAIRKIAAHTPRLVLTKRVIDQKNNVVLT